MKQKIFSDKVFFFLSLLVIAIAVFISINKFYITKDYDFHVEVSCNSEEEGGCLTRNCENGECPPNGLESYKEYTISAKNFELCENEDCTRVCKETDICQEV